MKTTEIINKLYTSALILSCEMRTKFTGIEDIAPETDCHLETARGLMDAALAQIQLAQIKQS